MTTDEMIARLMALATELEIAGNDMSALTCATCAGKLMIGEDARADAETLLEVLK